MGIPLDMANRKQNKRGKRRNRRKLRETSPRRQGQRSQDSGASTTVPPSGSATGAPKPKGKFEWVKIEHRDSEGNLTFSESLIHSTHARRYSEVEDRTQLRALVLRGYKPHALMLIERKIYKIHRLNVDGWRRRGQINIELDRWRTHEEDWFSAMQGVSVQITNLNRPPKTKGESYRVATTNFEKKNVSIHHRDGTVKELSMYEGTLDITETWKSAWRRHGAEVIDRTLRYVVLPFSVTLGASVAFIWLQGLIVADHETQDSPIREAPSVQTNPTAPNDGPTNVNTPVHSNTRSDPTEEHHPEGDEDHETDDTSDSGQTAP